MLISYDMHVVLHCSVWRLLERRVGGEYIPTRYTTWDTIYGYLYTNHNI